MLNFSMLYINFAGLGVGLGGWVGGQKIVKRLIYLNDFWSWLQYREVFCGERRGKMMNTAAPETEVKARMTSSWIEDKHQEEEKWNRERKLIENPRKKTLTMESESSNPQNGAYTLSKNLRHIQVKWNATTVYNGYIYIYIHMKYDKKQPDTASFFDINTSDRKLSDFKPQPETLESVAKSTGAKMRLEYQAQCVV